MTWLKCEDLLSADDEEMLHSRPPIAEPLGVNDLGELTLPSPTTMPTTSSKPTVWVVQQVSGDRLRVLADHHYTYARPEGTELRFFNGPAADNRSQIATVRAGSWHWCVAESSLDPKAAS